MRVLHIITELGIGGAERQLAYLVEAMHRQGHEVWVVSLRDGGENAERLRLCGIPVYGLGIRNGATALGGWFALVRILRRLRPQVVQSWLYHADLLATLATLASGRPPLIWNLRCSELDPGDHSAALRAIIRLLVCWSRRPTAVVVNSQTGRAAHDALGYRPSRWEVIPNGLDVQAFVPSVAAKYRLRQELGLAADTPLVGLVGRYHPMKDHGNFLAAAAKVHAARPDVHFVLVGRRVEWGNHELREQVERFGLGGRAHLLGQRYDMEMIDAALDVATCSSYSEGFPNVLAEAMSCEVPCVSTAVGDAASIVGDTGEVVPPRDPEALANGILHLINAPEAARRELGRRARLRIADHFSIAAAVQNYLRLYREIAAD